MKFSLCLITSALASPLVGSYFAQLKLSNKADAPSCESDRYNNIIQSASDTPWFGAITFGNWQGLRCGGVFIAPNAFLTLKSCIDDQSIGNLQIHGRIGKVNDGEIGDLYSANWVSSHSTMDLALVRLTTLAKYAFPTIAQYSYYHAEGKVRNIVGWQIPPTSKSNQEYWVHYKYKTKSEIYGSGICKDSYICSCYVSVIQNLGGDALYHYTDNVLVGLSATPNYIESTAAPIEYINVYDARLWIKKQLESSVFAIN